MQSRQFTIEQIAVLKEKLRPTESYLKKVGERLLERNFVAGDPMYRLTWAAQVALSELVIYLEQLELEATSTKNIQEVQHVQSRIENDDKPRGDS